MTPGEFYSRPRKPSLTIWILLAALVALVWFAGSRQEAEGQGGAGSELAN
jgi:hypothetical protein